MCNKFGYFSVVKAIVWATAITLKVIMSSNYKSSMSTWVLPEDEAILASALYELPNSHSLIFYC